MLCTFLLWRRNAVEVMFLQVRSSSAASRKYANEPRRQAMSTALAFKSTMTVVGAGQPISVRRNVIKVMVKGIYDDLK